MTAWAWDHCTVDRVIDGDTFTAVLTFVSAPIDCGFHATTTFQTSFTQRLRLNRVNAKPHSTPEGKAAAARVDGWLRAEPFHVVTVGAYKYGDEWMAEVTQGTVNLSDLLIAEGLAVAWDGHGKRPDGSVS